MSLKTTNVLQEGEVLEPSGYNVLLKVDGTDAMFGSFLLEEADGHAKRAATRGVVIAVGPLAGREPRDCPENWHAVVGNEVLFEAFEGQYIEDASGTAFIIVPEKAIQGRVIKRS